MSNFTTEDYNKQISELLKHQKGRVNRFIKACKSKFSKSEYLIDKPFFDIVCGGLDEDFLPDSDGFIMEDIDEILSTKNRADVFFSFFKNSDIIWYDNYLSHWGSQTQGRMDRWKLLTDKIDSYCMKYYRCHWGKQHATYEEPIPKYKPLTSITSTKDIKANMKNRPLYKGKTLIGYIKDIVKVGIIVGTHPEWDSVDDDYYPNVPDWEYHHNSIMLYGEPKKVRGVSFYNKDNNTYILEDNLDKYSILEDRVVLKA